MTEFEIQSAFSFVFQGIILQECEDNVSNVVKQILILSIVYDLRNKGCSPFPPLFQIKMSENQGFKNTNNRCFSIVAVQMIFSNVDLLNFIQDAKSAKLVKKGKGDLLRELRRLTNSTSTKEEDLGTI